RGDARPVGRARARNLRARGLGRERSDPLPFGPIGLGLGDVRAPLALVAGVVAVARPRGLRGRVDLRLVRPPPSRRRGGHELRLPRAEQMTRLPRAEQMTRLPQAERMTRLLWTRVVAYRPEHGRIGRGEIGRASY